MRYLKKWYVLIIVCFFVEIAMNSCASKSNYKKMMKHRGSYSSARRGYGSSYKRKIKRHSMPIAKNYIIKNRTVR
ncbi:MAG: hypothetical protein HXX09_05130 [Bacteroidetes bacterium]|nr:hypothetical protein [Bacteroidota bacterium]